jgi:hypothetical protein
VAGQNQLGRRLRSRAIAGVEPGPGREPLHQGLEPPPFAAAVGTGPGGGAMLRGSLTSWLRPLISSFTLSTSS